MLNTEAEAEEVERRRKLEEALEVKALRRIISAFINYPEASEEDIKRYERSFRKLPQAHKVLYCTL
nr:carnosine N-methyltransferase isoform X2 [Ipomoea batatas]